MEKMFPMVGKIRPGVPGGGKGLRDVLGNKWNNGATKQGENMGGLSIMTVSDNGGFVEKHDPRCADRNGGRGAQGLRLCALWFSGYFFQSLEKGRKIFPIIGKSAPFFPTIGKPAVCRRASGLCKIRGGEAGRGRAGVFRKRSGLAAGGVAEEAGVGESGGGAERTDWRKRTADAGER